MNAPLRRCPSCGRTFANRNQARTCAPLGERGRHFAAASPHVRATFDRILEVVAGLGPVSVEREPVGVADLRSSSRPPGSP